MELILKRTRFRDTITTGQLYVDGAYFCFTLEDMVREPKDWDGKNVEKWKIKEETAIPSGLYNVTLEDSPHFGPETMTINKVPGFDLIRIHAGNTEKDTEGCVIVGYKVRDDGVIIPGSTRPAVADLKALVRKSESTTIRILN